MDPNKPYPGTVDDCGKSPELQRLIEQFESLKVDLLFDEFTYFERLSFQNMIADTKQDFDCQSINMQPLEGVRYVYNPFSVIKESSRM